MFPNRIYFLLVDKSPTGGKNLHNVLVPQKPPRRSLFSGISLRFINVWGTNSDKSLSPGHQNTLKMTVGTKSGFELLLGPGTLDTSLNLVVKFYYFLHSNVTANWGIFLLSKYKYKKHVLNETSFSIAYLR